MYLIIKTLCFGFLGFWVGEIFPQEQLYISTNGNINNAFPKRSIYNVSNITPLKNKNSSEVLDSLICVYLNGDKIKIAYNYNDDLTLDYFTLADWFNGEWVVSDKRTNTYNFEGKLETVLWEWFNTSLQEWLNDAKDVYNYDSLGNRDLYLHLNFNGQEFLNDFKYENSYDIANNLVSSVNQDWIDSIWVNRSKIINTYTSNNLKDSALFQEWINNQWINSQMGNFEYDENYNTIAILSKIWIEQQWIDYALGLFEYDENDNLIIENVQIAGNNNWENWFRIFYEYYENNNLIHLFGEEWENGQWVPENEPLKVTNPDGILYGYLAKEIFLYYSPPTSIESEKNIASEFKLLQNYPNPFNPNTVISYNIPEHSLVTLNIYNLLGEEIKTLVKKEQAPGNYQINFSGNSLPSGIYFYQLKTNKFRQTKKMLLMR